MIANRPHTSVYSPVNVTHPSAQALQGARWKSSVLCFFGPSLCTVFVLAIVLLSGTNSTAEENPTIESPAIRRLAQQLQAGHATAADEFWSQVAAQHAPLIESGSGDSSLVTFVWRGDKQTKNVVVITPLALVHLEDAILQNLPGTDLWYKTYHMRNDARMSYRFAVNDSLVPFDREPNFFARMKTWQVDPNNPRQFEVGMGITASVLESSEAPSDKWTRKSAGVPAGTITKVDFSSQLLHNTRPAWIYTPATFHPDANYPLLIFQDGESYTTLVPMPTILDNLIAAKAIPPVVAVLLGNAAGDGRDSEMNCNRIWSDSLVKEVLPWLKTAQNLKFVDGNITIVGDSLTGLAAACAAHDYPRVIDRVISQSGSFYRAPSGEEPEWLARHLATEETLPVQFYLEIGLLETASIPNRDPSMLTSNRHLRDVLLAKGNRVRYVEHFSGHEHLSWRASISDALIYMLK